MVRHAVRVLRWWVLPMLAAAAAWGQAAGTPTLTFTQAPYLFRADRATLTVRASHPATYVVQWYKDGQMLGNRTNYSGSTALTRQIDSVEASDAGEYWLELTTTAGVRVTSPRVRFSVVEPIVFLEQPKGRAAPLRVGETTTTSVSVVGPGTISYQWYRTGLFDTPIEGATESTLTVRGDAAYGEMAIVAEARNAYQTVRSAIARFTVLQPPKTSGPPRVTGTSPDGVFSLQLPFVEGTPPLRYQWSKDGVLLESAGRRLIEAETGQLTVSGASSADDGEYRLIVTNAYGTATSEPVRYTYTVAPSFVAASLEGMQSQTVEEGATVRFSVEATGAPAPTYQWFSSAGAIAGATGPSLTLTAVTRAQAGNYFVQATNPLGRVLASATLTVRAAPAQPVPTTRLGNLSVRTRLAGGGERLIVGFVVGGTTSTKRFLLRGVGPGLRQFGVGEAAEAATVALYRDGGTELARAATWEPRWQTEVFPAVGAFALPPGSRDGVISLQADARSYTAHVEAAGGGEVLAELYDRDAQGHGARFINLSARGRAGGGQSLIAGIVVTGTGRHDMLVRGVGPTLGDLGVGDAIAAPQLRLYLIGAEGPALLATHTGWLEGLGDAFARAGAFPLRAGSRDAAMLLRLVPGAYTVELTNLEPAAGTALIEVYEMREAR